MAKSKWAADKVESFKISEDTATGQVKELLAHYKLDVEDIESEPSRKAFESSLNKLVKAYQRGQLENKKDDKGRFQVIQHLSAAPGEVSDITYDELKGKHKVAMDGLEGNDTYARQQALLGSLSGLGSKAMQALSGIDMSIAECLGFVFLMV